MPEVGRRLKGKVADARISSRTYQKAKLRSFLKYFDWLDSGYGGSEETDSGTDSEGNEARNAITISRRVFSGKQWLTIEDWLECEQPLCSMEVKHEGRIERTPGDVVQTVFASPRLGGNVLSNGDSQESMHFSTFPELLAILLYVEALEDNEAIFVEGARQLNRFMMDSNRKVNLEELDESRKVGLITTRENRLLNDLCFRCRFV